MAALYGRNPRRPSIRRRKSSARASSVRAAPPELASDGSVDAAVKSAEEVISKPQQARAAREAAGSARPVTAEIKAEGRAASQAESGSFKAVSDRGSRNGGMLSIGALARSKTMPVANPAAWAAVAMRPAPGEEALKRELQAELELSPKARKIVELERYVSSRAASSTGSEGPFRPQRARTSPTDVFDGVAMHEPRADNEARVAAYNWLKELEKGNTPGVRAPRSTRVADDLRGQV